VFAGGLTLDPGQYMVIARTPSVFESIYGSGINVAAGGYANANLSNGGETISLRTAAGATFFTFTYSDDSPWPEAADGDGPSLEIIDPLGDPNDPTNWRASAADGGSPGDNGEPSSDLAGDYDNSGTVDDLDYDEWRDQYGTFVANPGDGADGNQDGLVNTADYIVWRNNFGATVAVAATVPTPSVNPQPVVDENEPADLPPVALNLTAESRNRFEVRRYEPRLLTRDASFDELLLTAISATPNHVATVEDIFQTPADDPTDVHPNAISAALDELFPDQLAATQLSSF
jgi:hypothetical protein